ncbi:MAG: cytochrome bc1 complex diheme cytochrome c subunit [Nocardioides sp.]
MRLLNATAGRLSRHRRGPIAGLLVILTALLLTGGLYAALSPSQANTAIADDELVSEGRELFLVSCSSCHGANAEGIKTATADSDQVVGPSLVGVGAAAVDFQMRTGRMPMMQPGQQAAAKKSVFDDGEIEAIGAFIASLAPGPGVPDAELYDPSTYSSQQDYEAALALGGQIFLTNCTACHNFTGAGGAMPRGGVAPSILNTEPRLIYEALLTGPGPMDEFSDGNIPPAGKKAVIAYVESMADQTGYGGFSLGSMGPVSEGAAAWIIGIGTMIGFAVWIAGHTTRTDKKKKESAA